MSPAASVAQGGGFRLEHGYAQVMTVPPNLKHQDLFLRLQLEAREAGRGLWAR